MITRTLLAAVAATAISATAASAATYAFTGTFDTISDGYGTTGGASTGSWTFEFEIADPAPDYVYTGSYDYNQWYMESFSVSVTIGGLTYTFDETSAAGATSFGYDDGYVYGYNYYGDNYDSAYAYSQTYETDGSYVELNFQIYKGEAGLVDSLALADVIEDLGAGGVGTYFTINSYDASSTSRVSISANGSNAAEVSAVPLPAGAWLLLGGLGALGIARRRKS